MSPEEHQERLASALRAARGICRDPECRTCAPRLAAALEAYADRPQ